MDYIIVTVKFPDHISSLQSQVKEKITQGYEPIGGLVVWKDSLAGQCFSQAMTKQIFKTSAEVDPNTGLAYEVGVGW